MNFLLQEIASEVQSESKWKQLGELAMSTGKVSLLFLLLCCIFFLLYSMVYLLFWFHSHVLTFYLPIPIQTCMLCQLGLHVLVFFNFISYIELHDYSWIWQKNVWSMLWTWVVCYFSILLLEMLKGYQNLQLLRKSKERTMLHSFVYSCWDDWKIALSCWWKGSSLVHLKWMLDHEHLILKSLLHCCYIQTYMYEYFLSSKRIPEAALMARSYLPSKVSEIVAIWRKDLNKVTLLCTPVLCFP